MKVFWTQEERDKVYREFSRIIREMPGQYATDSWKESQKVLPIHRHRSFNASSSASTEGARYREWKTSHREEPKPIAESQPKNPVPHGKILFIEGAGAMKQETYDAVIAHHAKEVVANPPTLDEVLNRLVGEKIKPVLQAMENHFIRIEKSIKDSVHDEMGVMYERIMEYFEPKAQVPGPEDQVPGPEFASAVENQHRPIVVILNAKEDQRKAIQEKFPGLDVRRSADGNVPAYQKADLFIGMTKFMKHGLEEGVISRFGKDNYHRVHGSASAIIRKLSELTANGVL